jgi:predicted secreted protein
MPIDPLLAVALFIICWWMALFCVLPIGVRSLEEAGEHAPSHDQGAPSAPNLKQKALWATWLGFALWVVVMGAIWYARR